MRKSEKSCETNKLIKNQLTRSVSTVGLKSLLFHGS